MSIWIVVLLVYLVWLGLGIWYLIHNLGNKGPHKEPWYAGVAMLPIWPIMPILRFIKYLSDLYDRFIRK